MRCFLGVRIMIWSHSIILTVDPALSHKGLCNNYLEGGGGGLGNRRGGIGENQN